MSIINITELSKSFGEVRALDGISFEVREGELFAFLGVNGAGKSTAINIICGQLERDGGEVEIDGQRLGGASEQIKEKLGVVFQSSVLDRSLSVRANLESRAALYGIHGEAFEGRLAEISELLELDGLMKRTLSRLSGGQKRRIDIARALIHRPRILILDEPTTGLDPQTRQMIWKVITDLRREEKMTVFLTTHYMEEAADADYVVIIDKGRISANGTPIELKTKYTGDFITLYGVDEESVRSLGLPYETLKDAYRLSVPNTAAATALIVARPELFVDYEISKGKMDDVFLAVTGKALGGEEETKEGGKRK